MEYTWEGEELEELEGTLSDMRSLLQRSISRAADPNSVPRTVSDLHKVSTDERLRRLEASLSEVPGMESKDDTTKKNAEEDLFAIIESGRSAKEKVKDKKRLRQARLNSRDSAQQDFGTGIRASELRDTASGFLGDNNVEAAVGSYQSLVGVELLHALLPNNVEVITQQVEHNIETYDDLFDDIRRRKYIQMVARKLLCIRIVRTWACWSSLRNLVRSRPELGRLSMAPYRWPYHINGGVRLHRLFLGKTVQKLPLLRMCAWGMLRKHTLMVYRARMLLKKVQARMQRECVRKLERYREMEVYFRLCMCRRFHRIWCDQAKKKARTRRYLLGTTFNRLPLQRAQAFETWVSRILWCSMVRQQILGTAFAKIPLVRIIALRMWRMHALQIKLAYELLARVHKRICRERFERIHKYWMMERWFRVKMRKRFYERWRIKVAVHVTTRAALETLGMCWLKGKLATSLHALIDDKQVLEDLYTTTAGSGWRRKRNWMSSKPLSEWEGVTVDGGGRVIKLFLQSNMLIGQLPDSIGRLWQLQVAGVEKLLHCIQTSDELELDDNRLSGPINPRIRSLKKLVILGLSANNFTGTIPSCVGELKMLEYFEVQYNALSGVIPPELGNCLSLLRINVGSNKLRGELPETLRNLHFLEDLIVFHTYIGGYVPAWLSECQALRYIGLYDNHFIGGVPRGLAELSRLRILELQRNYLHTGAAELVPDEVKRRIKFVYVQGQSTLVNLQMLQKRLKTKITGSAPSAPASQRLPPPI